jgi:hypothetical protein
MVYSAKSDDIGTINQFTRRKDITITTGGTSTPANYQVELTIAHESEMQSSFEDIRFNTKAGVYIDYWIETEDGSNATVWIELPNAITDPGSDTIWMFYGNAGLGDEGDIGDTFLFGDDIEDGTLNKWGGATSAYAAAGGAAYQGSYGIDRTQADGSWQFLTGSGDIQNGIWEAWVRQGNSASYPGSRARYLDGSNYVDFTLNSAGSEIGINDVGGTGNHLETLATSTATWYFMRVTLNGTAAKLQVYNTSMSLLQTLETTVADRTDAFGLKCYRDAQFDTYKLRKYIANEPTPSYGTAQHQRRTPIFIG